MAQLATQLTRKTIRLFANIRHSKIINIEGCETVNSAHVHFRSISTTQVAGTVDRLYTETHEWITVNDNVGTVGISNYAQNALGDVVFAQLPEVGNLINKDEECGALESVKAASEIASPVTGKIVASNEELVDKPGLVNGSCYDAGWLFKIELKNPDEIKSLMDEKSYNEFLKTDPH